MVFSLGERLFTAKAYSTQSQEKCAFWWKFGSVVLFCDVFSFAGGVSKLCSDLFFVIPGN